jgi:cytochrome c556
MDEKGCNIMRRINLAVLLCLSVGIGASRAQDARELVRLPKPMQEHMLGNMRDHLATLNEIIGDVANDKFDEAAKITEQRLGMSSLSAHGAAHLAPYFPKPMQDIGTSMHHASSRLVIVLQNASVTPTVDAMREINKALHEVTTACEACHASYRLR